ncbi:MAG: glycosyltransferase family 4 protein [Myxococcales bacterium]|nr:glycosyltransferase family 4 protein [Myxococcales bacterium]MCB9582267.1 glycosyltransferase family 4 protein [Polyangiaceae bacterium]
MATTLLDLSVLATNTRTRGIGRYVADLALGIARAKRETTDLRVLGIERLGWVGNSVVTEDLEGAVERLTDLSVPARAHANWAYRVRVSLAAAAQSVAPDLIHTGHPNATPIGDLPCPRVTTCHDLIPLHYPKHYLTWRDGYRVGREKLDHRRYHSARHVIAVSQTTADDLIGLLRVPAEKVTVVYNGVDLSRWSSEPGEGDAEVRARYGLSEASYILGVGAANWRKNPVGTIQALARARKSVADQNLMLVWAARLGSETQRLLVSTARQEGVEDAVRLIGYVPDDELAALYRGAVAQVFVSRAEGFGYPVVEAMATGCPVITSDRSSMAEIAGDAAVLVDPEQTDAIADAIVQLATDPDARFSFAQRGVARAQQFSLEKMARRTLDVYRKVIAEDRG